MIATKMCDRTLNDKVRLPFPYLVTKFFYHFGVPYRKFLDDQINVTKMVNLALIKDVNNLLFQTPTTNPVGQYAFPQAPP